MAEDNKPISYLPTDGMSYDPEETKYWDSNALNKEVERVFEVCHGCRMCFKFCDSFPSLFKFIDERHDGDVKKLERVEVNQVVDECFQCKLCEVQCPYTPRDKHEYQLDFPKLMHRYKAIRVKEEGVKFRDKVLGNPDVAAVAARSSLGLANKLNRVPLHRQLMEKVLGIHRDKLLPDFADSTFEKWATEQGRMYQPADPIDKYETVLFQTCYVQNNEPQIGRDTLEVMDRNLVNTTCVAGLKCCGMPAWESGDLEAFRKNAKHNLDILYPFAKAGAKILGINPTCSMMLRREYPELVAQEDREKAKVVSQHIQDPGEFLWSIRKEERFNTRFRSTPGEVSYHAPCHLRAQAVGFKGRDLMKKIPGVKPKMVLECCGHDGTYAMKVEGYEGSIRAGKRAFEGMKDNKNSKVWATECPLAAIQFQQHAGVKPMHPMTILARSYRDDGFPTKVEEEEGN